MGVGPEINPVSTQESEATDGENGDMQHPSSAVAELNPDLDATLPYSDAHDLHLEQVNQGSLDVEEPEPAPALNDGQIDEQDCSSEEDSDWSLQALFDREVVTRAGRKIRPPSYLRDCV